MCSRRHRLVLVAGTPGIIAWLLAGVLSACSGGHEAVDASLPDARELCWAGGGTPTPGASVEIGAGLSDFAPLEDEEEVPMYRGAQGGAHFFLHARIDGLDPGDPSGPRESKPSTWFSIHSESGEDLTGLPCDYPRAYELGDSGQYELPYGRAAQVEPVHLSWIFGSRVRVQVEVRDAEGRYATDERWVIAVEPPVEVDAGAPDAAPLPDGAPPDAGAPDGSAAVPDAAVSDAG